MKTKFLFIAVALLAITFATHAQLPSFADSKIKVFPAANKDLLKILYASAVNQPVTVTFYRGNMVFGEDRVSDNLSNGFIKKYDVTNIRGNVFWVKVASSKLSAIYKVTRSGKGGSFIPELESSTDGNLILVKSND